MGFATSVVGFGDAWSSIGATNGFVTCAVGFWNAVLETGFEVATVGAGFEVAALLVIGVVAVT